MNDRATEEGFVELAARMTVAEGNIEALTNRVDGHDETFAVQGRYIDGQQKQTDQLEQVVDALKQVANQATQFFAQWQAGLRIAGIAWKWVGRPLAIAAGSVAGAGALWILTHLSAIVHGLDKLNAILSK